MDKVRPSFNHDDRSHQYIWDFLAYMITDEDFEEIQKILIEREDTHIAIDKTQVMFTPFDEEAGMMQPRKVPEEVKQKGHRYADWSAAMDIWMILSKYADFYSKKR